MCILADYIHKSSNAMFYTEKGCTSELCFQKEKETGLSLSPAGERQGSFRSREVRSPVCWGQGHITQEEPRSQAHSKSKADPVGTRLQDVLGKESGK